jgi:hypothetical protein
MRIIIVATTSMTLRLIIMPIIPLLIHSVHPEEDILRRNKAKDTLDQTAAVLVKIAAI